jgi:16S rRNA (cytidine1402-2'-O)-methyltransferase
MLYVVATPIGNLADITFRAVDTLKNCDYILCEDTRHSHILLQHYDIKKPLKSFHKFSEMSKQNEVINDLKQGLSICLISDAGTPGISDPGEKLIQECLKNGIRVISIPGPCAAIAALCCSGLDTARFQFFGFLPRKASELRRTLQEILNYPGTTICYESPNRLIDVLIQLQELAPDRLLTVARELTKKFEEIKRDTAVNLIAYWKNAALKGEIVLMISSGPEKIAHDWDALSPQQHVEFMQQTYGATRQEAIIHVAKIRGASKREIYNAVHRTKNDNKE